MCHGIMHEVDVEQARRIGNCRMPAVENADLHEFEGRHILDELRAGLDEIRRAGYAVAAEELELGFVAVGAPVLDAAGRPVAPISLGGTLTRMANERIPEIGGRVRHPAQYSGPRWPAH